MKEPLNNSAIRYISKILDKNPNDFYFGRLCKNNHEFENTGKCIRYKNNKTCLFCKQIANKEYRESNYEKMQKLKKEWYSKNKNKILEKQKGYRIENKDHIRELIKQWYEKNKEHVKEYKREYRQKNKDRIRAYFKQWSKNNREYINRYKKQYMRKYRLKKKLQNNQE